MKADDVPPHDPDALNEAAKQMWMISQGFAQLDADPRRWEDVPEYAQEFYIDMARAAFDIQAPSVAYVRWSDDGQFIRKWSRKPFAHGDPHRLISDDEVDAVAEAIYLRPGADNQLSWQELPGRYKESWRQKARAGLAAADLRERERCAKICEERAAAFCHVARIAALECAAAIRSQEAQA